MNCTKYLLQICVFSDFEKCIRDQPIEVLCHRKKRKNEVLLGNGPCTVAISLPLIPADKRRGISTIAVLRLGPFGAIIML